MKRLLFFLLPLAVCITTASAIGFIPAPLKLSAPQVIYYTFDGSTFSLPVTVDGNPASVTFLVFTKDRAASIKKVTNGYLGWHYVNNIDTCLYVSPPFQFDGAGYRTVTWDGKDENGAPVPRGDYTYYIWGYGNVLNRDIMTCQIKFDQWAYRTIVTHDTHGNPLSQPLIYVTDHNRSSNPDPVNHTCSRWAVGDDPMDGSLLETTITSGWCDVGGLAFQPDDYRYFFHDTLKEAGQKITRKWQWVPGGESILQTDWGRNGEFSYTGAWPAGWNYGPGVVSDGADYLLTTTGDISGTSATSELIYINVHDGTEIKRLDLSPWWIRPEDGERGGQRSGGPTNLYMRHGLLGLGCYSSCLNQLIDPYYTDPADAILWSNGNGDYTGDKNWAPGSEKAWVCNDYNIDPYKYNISMDKNLFTVFPAFSNDLQTYSFGVFAPDGTGMGYHTIEGENGKILGIEIIDYGSYYDGIYTSNTTVPGVGVPDIYNSFWFIAYDSIKGTITSGSFLWVSSPSGGEVWGTGSPHRITWQSRGVNNVNIEYSDDRGASWNIIALNVPASPNSYDWTPQGIQSDRCLVRVSSSGDPSISGVSYATFTLNPPFVKVSEPNGGEVLATRTLWTITWSFLGIDRVNIEYSSDGGSTWNVIGNVNASKKVFRLKVPDAVSENCLVRISDSSHASISDTSDGVFKIIQSFIHVLSPNGGEEWEARAEYPVTWTASSWVLNIRIELSTDNGSTWSMIVDGPAAWDGSYAWRVSNIEGSKCLIRVSDNWNTGISDVSDGAFSIVPSTSPIWVSSPAGGEVWGTGSVHRITWQSNGVDTVNIDYSSDGGSTWKTVAGNVPASPGSYDWTPEGIHSDRCLVLVSSAGNPSIRGVSYAPFTISPPFVKVTVPNGGEHWSINSAHDITWTSVSVARVLIEYSSDGGSSWQQVDTVDAVAGLYKWTVPNLKSDMCLIRVTDAEASARTDTGDGVFSITTADETYMVTVGEETPRAFAVYQNTPNPFNPSTAIAFALPRAEAVRVDIFNVSGQRAGCAFDGRMERGRHTVVWNAGDLSAGLYFACVRAGTETKTVKMLLLK